MADSVASVSSWEVRPGHEAEFERLGDELIDAATRVGGHLSGTTLHEDRSTEYHLVHSFAALMPFVTRLLKRWLYPGPR